MVFGRNVREASKNNSDERPLTPGRIASTSVLAQTKLLAAIDPRPR